MEVSGQLHAPAALLAGQVPSVLTGQDAGWAPETTNMAVEQNVILDVSRQQEVGGECSTHGRDDKCTYIFGRKLTGT